MTKRKSKGLVESQEAAAQGELLHRAYLTADFAD
jgi:hypothetical protein